jgi:hypothetical protein
MDMDMLLCCDCHCSDCTNRIFAAQLRRRLVPAGVEFTNDDEPRVKLRKKPG